MWPRERTGRHGDAACPEHHLLETRDDITAYNTILSALSCDITAYNTILSALSCDITAYISQCSVMHGSIHQGLFDVHSGSCGSLIIIRSLCILLRRGI